MNEYKQYFFFFFLNKRVYRVEMENQRNFKSVFNSEENNFLLTRTRFYDYKREI